MSATAAQRLSHDLPTGALFRNLEARAECDRPEPTFYGFVDNTINAATNTTDVTMAGPYTWRN